MRGRTIAWRRLRALLPSAAIALTVATAASSSGSQPLPFGHATELTARPGLADKAPRPWEAGPPQAVGTPWEVLVKGGCQGVILDSRVVLTSASCTVGREPGDLEIAAGSPSSTSHLQKRGVSHIVEYTRSAESSDPFTALALLVLEAPVDIGEFATELPLATPEEIAEADAGRIAHHVDGASYLQLSWGFLADDVGLVGAADCQAPREPCRDTEKSEGILTVPAASGSPGGGLVIAGSDGGPALAGVATDSGTFTRITGHVDWIDATLRRVDSGLQPLSTDRLSPTSASGSAPTDPCRELREGELRSLGEWQQLKLDCFQFLPGFEDPPSDAGPDGSDTAAGNHAGEGCSYWVECDSITWEEGTPYGDWPPVPPVAEEKRPADPESTCHVLRFDDNGRLTNHLEMPCSEAP